MEKAIALGTFDGIHQGHRQVISNTLNCNSIAVTFNIPPKAAITGECELLMLPEDRSEKLYELGINEIITLDFEKVRNISPMDFLIMLKDKYNPKIISCGFNYRFGKNAVGDTKLLNDFCNRNGIEFLCSKPFLAEEEILSSTIIRNMIKNGEIKKANQYIYKGFGFKSVVKDGDKRGRTLGFPTINQEYPEMLVKAKFGSYISKALIDQKEYKAVTNIGVRPTFKTQKITCETFILDFKGDLYGKWVEIKPLEFLREEKKFSNIKDLKKAVFEDIAKTSEYPINIK